MIGSDGLRRGIKRGLAAAPAVTPASGFSILIYHRVGGGTVNELDLPVDAFRRQIDLLDGHDVVSLDGALDRLDEGDRRPSVVLTFDDGFQDVYRHAWPVLRERRMPFTIYLATAYMGQIMRWEGSTAHGPAGQGVSWRQLEEMVASDLLTIGNHAHDHVPPTDLDETQLDACTARVEQHLGITPRHFTYPWGVAVPRMEAALRARFRSASTGELGRNGPDVDRMRLRRIPVRRSDPDAFFSRKLTGGLAPERIYGRIVRLG